MSLRVTTSQSMEQFHVPERKLAAVVEAVPQRGHRGVSKQLLRLELLYRAQIALAATGRCFGCTNPTSTRKISDHFASTARSMPCVGAKPEFRRRLTGVPRFPESEP
jgi:hypothetical protein